MPKSIGALLIFAATFPVAIVETAMAQSLGNYGNLRGMVLDASGASVADATILLENPLTGVRRTTSSDAQGAFQLAAIPFGNYRLTASAPGFQDFRMSYARLFETPYNENLIVASEAGANSQTANPFGTFRSSPPRPGRRNQFNAGLAQAFGRYFSIDADYFWKFTQNAFDFDSLFLTPITFPIGWRKSKIDGLAARITLAEFHGFSAYTVMGHTRSRFFGPEIGGLIFNSVPDNGVFRIDHSEEFEQTTFLRYQYRKSGPWVSLTWRFNSGLALPGVVPDYSSALRLTADQQAQMGLYCGDVYATRSTPITSCNSPIFGATRVSIPPPGRENDDLRPTRVTERNILDAGAGIDDLLQTDDYKIQVRFTILNLTNQEALYNFLSTFSGTHFVTPRAMQVEVRLVF